ncbi:MAG: NUDIX domain-containing protein [Patescibacteria group bacterium]
MSEQRNYFSSAVYLAQKTFVFRADGKFLTLLRSDISLTRPGAWDLPGGAYEQGDTPKESAQREIVEETGITITEIKPLDVRGHKNSVGEYVITIAYRTQTASEDVTLSSEHTDYRWVTPEEFLTLESSAKWQSIVRDNLL